MFMFPPEKLGSRFVNKQGWQRKRPRWTQEEDILLRLMREEGRTAKFIAEYLKRPLHSVNHRLTKTLGIIRNKKQIKHHRYIEPTPMERVTTLKFLVPTYYEAGWRVTSFLGDSVILERANYDEPAYKIQTCLV